MKATFVAMLGVALVLAGCRSKPVPPAPPAALADADRLAREGARLLAQENWPGAVAWWQRAGQNYRLLNRLELVALARHNEAVARRALGESATARKLWEEAAQLNQSLGRTNDWWRNQLSLFQLEVDVDPDGAGVRRAALESRQGELTGEPGLAAHWAAEEARWHGVRGNAAEAMASATLAVQRFAAVHDRAGEAAAWCTVGRAARQMGRSAEAVAAWRKALALFEGLGHPRGIAAALAGLGGALVQEGNAVEGRGFLAAARDNYLALRRDADAGVVAAELAAAEGGPGTGP